ncbi:UNVERIFIED_CONTAM: hypothetical protein Slati_0944700 [Sesamum latifolium]|uniref:Reverse transcriptase n=1 Tax=Sesamum latifolium TaxID=2727402 RepID=A0AAW2XPV9_9LAMI
MCLITTEQHCRNEGGYRGVERCCGGYVSKEQILWKQRAKALWLAAGDHNTGFFHAKANTRQVRKEIKNIRDENGETVNDKEGIQGVVLRYFRSIFTSTTPPTDIMEEVLTSLECCVTPAMNEALLQPFTSEEITHPLHQMHPIKSLARTESSRYLGTRSILVSLPSLVRSKRELFNSIKDRMWSKLHNWVAKKLSQEGRAVLLTIVLQTIPTYAMSCFRLPDSFLSDLESIMADFLWHDDEESRIHWMAWAKLCKPKSEGGLGFRRLKEFNLALLAKQVRRITLCPRNMLHTVIRIKYFPGSTIFEARLGACPSYTWRSIWASRNILAAGLRWRVGDGHSISITGHPWLPRPSTFQLIECPISLPVASTVASLITSTKEWNEPLIRAEFCPLDVDCILGISLSVGDSRDDLI